MSTDKSSFIQFSPSCKKALLVTGNLSKMIKQFGMFLSLIYNKTLERDAKRKLQNEASQ